MQEVGAPAAARKLGLVADPYNWTKPAVAGKLTGVKPVTRSR